DLPAKDACATLIANVLGTFPEKNFPFDKAARISEGLSQAEIDHVCRDAIKLMILENKNQVTFQLFQDLLKERNSAYHVKKK
ncbi:MAG: ATPase, partial [Candidatus Omnitrophica bacterium]|nr:ATPase [Candidatus Omnitrophota bacterium]